MVKDEAGYTLVELVVAMGMVSLIVGLAFTVYHFSLREMRNWRERMSLENKAHMRVNAISRDLLNLKQLLIAQPKAIGFVRQQGDTVFISMENDSLQISRAERLKIGLVAGKSYFNYWGSDLNLDTNSNGEVSFEEMDRDRNGILTGNELKSVRLIGINLGVGNGKQEFEARTAVAVRNLELNIEN